MGKYLQRACCKYWREKPLKVTWAVPIFRRDVFTITINHRALTVPSKKEAHEGHDEKSKNTWMEFRQHAFKISFALPKAVNV